MKKCFASLLSAGLLLFAVGMSPVASAEDAAPAAAPAATAPAAAAPAAAPAAEAAPAEAAAVVPNKGDTTWMIVATLLVIMMSIPGLALFYGGLVRSKNMLSVLMQVMMIFSLVIVLWFIYGYSLAFTEGGSFFGSFDRLFMNLWLLSGIY